MLAHLSCGNRIVVCFEPTDMRCGRYRLARLAELLLCDPVSGDWFVFFNKRRTATKIMYYAGGGYAVWHKVLERGTYDLPQRREISLAELLCILEGIDVSNVKKKLRYSARKG